MRPVLRPGLRMHRDAQQRAVLCDHERVYRLDDVTAALLESLDGLLDEACLLTRHPGEGAAAAWQRLRDGDVVVDVEEAIAPVRTLQQRARADALRETTTLVAHQPTTAQVRWQRRRTHTVAVTGDGMIAADVVTLLQRAGVGAVHTRTRASETDVTVLAQEHEPATATVEALMRGGRPHVVAGFRGVAGVVGPFVRPGTTCCLRCVDLARAAADPGWAAVREQVSRPTTTAGAGASPGSCVTTTAVAALVVADVLAHVEGREPATLNATLSMSLHQPVPTTTRWPMQPACGCAWHAHVTSRGEWIA